MKEAVTKVIDTLTQEVFHGAFQKLFERYNVCIAAGGDYFGEDKSFMCVLSIKVPIRKKSGNLINDPRIYPKVNIIARQEFELVYYDSVVHRFNHYTTRTLPYNVFNEARTQR